MEIQINFEDMNWLALAPELTVLFTAFFLLLVGLKKSLSTNGFLSKVTLAGVLVALLFSLALWGQAPSPGTEADPEIFSHSLIHDRFSIVFNLLFLLMAVFVVFSSFRYPQE
nr:NADH-quinone oxidoreductase, subunit N [Nitrospinaceae bacterium]NIR54723.1 NADH-quinone oxidoreductase, subunit N [Nitrospinaceae bacterium]NIS85143.1 NADH-quinone oxidoreductase, subunit N [Nitrospinaceae bacterium]NIT81960.1 NADH-quinone oxidoreductase, subunit N [Nitrospinaceae bacterium]NIU44222.1 NADH-quinone oxidoreductase, subunit N [Nitrospinaceae bacterium]